MATEVLRRRGTTAQHSAFTGGVGEVTVDTTKDTTVVHDGATAGGFPLLREDFSNATASTGRVALELDTTDNVEFAELTVTNIQASSLALSTDLAVTHGGTGASSASGARTNLGLVIGTDVQAWDADLDTYAANPLTSAELDQLQNIGSLTFSAQSWTNLNDISLINVADGDFIVGSATGWVAESGATARTSLGVAIGSDVQAYDAGLQSISGLTTVADRMIYTTASDTYAVTTLTSFARTILDDADASAVRSTLGLGSLATLSSINNSNWSGADLSVANGGTGASTASSARTNLGVAIGSDVQAWDADLDTYVANPLTAAELGELQNIGATTISSTQWGYLGALDQALGTTDDVDFNSGTFGTGNGQAIISTWDSTSDADIYGLIQGIVGGTPTTQGAFIQGGANGHLVLGLRENNTTDSFAIVSGGGNYISDSTYDTVLLIIESNGEAQMNANLDLNGTLDISGALTGTSATFSGALTVSSGGIDVTGNSSITGTLDVSGVGTFTGNLVHVDSTSADAVLQIENTGNGNSSELLFTRERLTGTGVDGASLFLKSDTATNDAIFYIQAQTAGVSQNAAALIASNGVRIRLDGGSANLAFELGATEMFSINETNMTVSAVGLFTNTTQATSSSVASVEFSGGLGVAKDIFISSTSDIYSDDYALGSDGTGWLNQSTPASGFGLVNGATSDMYLDNLTVRGRLRAFELIIKQISTIGGTEIMSIANGVAESVSGVAGSEVVTIEDPNGYGASAFAVNDLILVQQVDLNDLTGTVVKQEWREVSAVSGKNVTLTSLSGAPTPSSAISSGDVLVAFGNDTTASRQNIIYRNVEGGAPLVRLHAGINSYADFATSPATTTVLAYGEMNGLVTGISSSEIGMIIGDATLTSNYILATENQFEANLDTFTLEAGTADSLLITSDTSTQTAYTPTDDTSALVTNASLTSSVTFYGAFTTVDESLGWEGERLSFGTLSYNGTSDRIEMTMDCTGVTSSNRLRVWQDQETMTNYQNKTITFNFNLSTLPTSAAWSTTIPTHLIIYAYDSGTRREIARETIGAVSSTPADKSVTAHIPEWADSFRWAIVADEGNYTSLTTDRTLYINSITTDVYDKVQTTLNTDGLTVYGSPINELKFTKSDGVQIKGAKIRSDWMMLPEYRDANDLPTPDAGYASVAIIEVGGNKELWIRDDEGNTHSVTLT